MSLTNLLVPEGLSDRINVAALKSVKPINKDQYNRDKILAKKVGPIPLLADFNYNIDSGNPVYSGIKNLADIFTSWYKEKQALNFFKDEENKISGLKRNFQSYLSTIENFRSIYKAFNDSCEEEVQNLENKIESYKGNYQAKKQRYDEKIAATRNDFFGTIKKGFLNLGKRYSFLKYFLKKAKEKTKIFAYKANQSFAQEKVEEADKMHGEVSNLVNRIRRVEDIYVNYLLTKKQLLN